MLRLDENIEEQELLQEEIKRMKFREEIEERWRSIGFSDKPAEILKITDDIDKVINKLDESIIYIIQQ